MSNGLDKLKMGSILSLKLNLTLKVKVNCPPKTIGIWTKVFCFSGPNLVILAWTGDELLCGQASDWYTHTHRHRQRQYPEAKTGLRSKWNGSAKYCGRYRANTIPSTDGWTDEQGDSRICHIQLCWSTEYKYINWRQQDFQIPIFGCHRGN